MFKGAFTALVTPFDKNKQVDEAKFRELIDNQIENGIDGVVPCGCTGEAATLTCQEQKRLIKITVEQVNRRVPVMAGTGSNSTEEAIDLTSYAKKTGADAALVITPYYNKPTAKGQMEHYKMIAKEVDIPIVLYNVPSRTGISISPEVVAELSKIDNIVAIKEASGSLKQVNNILSISDITVLSGDDFLTLPILSVGGQGVVSVTSNIMPQEVSNMVNSYLQGNIEKARNLHFKMYPVFKGMFIETNPICVKTAMKMMNMLNGQLRMPLSSMEKENEEELKKILIDAGLIRR